MSKRKIIGITVISAVIVLLAGLFLILSNDKSVAPETSKESSENNEEIRERFTTENEAEAISADKRADTEKELIVHAKETFDGDCEPIEYPEENPLQTTLEELDTALIDHDGNRGLLVFCNEHRFYGKDSKGEWQSLYASKDFMPSSVLAACRLENLVATFGKPLVRDVETQSAEYAEKSRGAIEICAKLN